MSKYFNLNILESDIDYIISVNELNLEFIDDLLSTSGGTTTIKQIMSAFKTNVILYFFYIKLADKEEKYELSHKLMRVIEFERMSCYNQLINKKAIEEGLDAYLDSIVDEIKYLILNK